MNCTPSEVRADRLTRFDGELAATAACPCCGRRIVAKLSQEETRGACWCGAKFKIDACQVAPTVPL